MEYANPHDGYAPAKTETEPSTDGADEAADTVAATRVRHGRNADQRSRKQVWSLNGQLLG
jgi:hypothetical protein